MAAKDVVEYAEGLLAERFDPQPDRYVGARGTIRALIRELKAERAKNAQLIAERERAIAEGDRA